MMDRRTALLTLLSIPLGSLTGFATAATSGKGVLRIPLDQWSGLIIEHAGRQILYTPADIFTILTQGEITHETPTLPAHEKRPARRPR